MTEDQGIISKLMSKTIYRQTLEVLAPNENAYKEINLTKAKEISAINAKDFDTLKTNVPISLGNKIVDTFPYCHMENHKRIMKGKSKQQGYICSLSEI